ncbi:MAG: hypothetical protein FJ319_12220 [SAR202 cluster bacterium]|nr:hypothetical protein [SAR202 cluster bacterium]
MPSMPSVKATAVTAPPVWAILERKVMEVMEQGAHIQTRKYAERSGAWTWYDDMDDYYERTHNWALLYAMGGGESLLDMAHKHWNATTRLFDDRNHDRGKGVKYMHGTTEMAFRHNNHNEYFGLANPGDAEWHHMGEGNLAFYGFGVGDPTVSENVRRSRRFAAMFIGEDPEAPNYDPKHRVIRSPMNSSQGPWHSAELNEVKTYLHGGNGAAPNWSPKSMGVRSSLYPIVKEPEMGWWNNPARAAEIIKVFNHVVLNCDIPHNMGATGLVTNAYLYTHDDKYKKWVLEYVEAWMDRIKKNKGIIPDNVGPTGKPGEHREGVWWGSMYGYNSYVGWSHVFHGMGVGFETALMLTGDMGYTEMLRSQVKMLLENSFKDPDGQLLVPSRAGPEGWLKVKGEWDNTGPTDMRLYELAHLYHATQSKEDYQIITHIRDNDRRRDWNKSLITAPRAEWDTEYSRFQFYDGKNPSWPENALSVNYQWAVEMHQRMANDARTVDQIIKDNLEPRNAVYTKILTQIMFGAPHTLYHGGLLRATVRYYHTDPVVGDRPGLPADVAALVDKLGPDVVGVHLVNLSRHHTRKVVIQSGAFGEHTLTDVRTQTKDGVQSTPVNGKYFQVELAPSTSIRVEAGLKRFANKPSYAFPWHGERIPVPFQ